MPTANATREAALLIALQPQQAQHYHRHGPAPKARPQLRQLAAEADVVLENFKAGGLAQYGLDYASLNALNPQPDLLLHHRLRPRRPLRRARRLRLDGAGHVRPDEHHRPCRRRARRRPAEGGRGGDRRPHRPVRQQRASWPHMPGQRQHRHRPGPVHRHGAAGCAGMAVLANQARRLPGQRRSAARAWAMPTPASRPTRTFPPAMATCCWPLATTASSRAFAQRCTTPNGRRTRALPPTRPACKTARHCWR